MGLDLLGNIEAERFATTNDTMETNVEQSDCDHSSQPGRVL
jgi:hypothetical protein